MELGPDLIVATGRELVDAPTLVTASHLDQQLLLIGGQLPEPTGNVTAVTWSGARLARGSEVADSYRVALRIGRPCLTRRRTPAARTRRDP